MRVVVPDLQAYERFLADKLTRIPGVANIQSSFAIKQVVYNTRIPGVANIQSSFAIKQVVYNTELPLSAID